MSDKVTIYWCPITSKHGIEETNTNILYKNPRTLFSDLYQNRNEEILSGRSFFSCPVTSKKMKNTYVFDNPTEATFEFKEDKVFLKNQKNNFFIDMNVVRKSPIKDTMLLLYDAQWIFFADEPLTASFSAPYLHRSKFLESATSMMGKFDIGRWFRPYNVEFLTWKPEGEISLLQEPLFYVEFETEKPIELKRFTWNRSLESLKNSCVQITNLSGEKQGLENRYKQFEDTSTKDLVLREIKNSII